MKYIAIIIGLLLISSLGSKAIQVDTLNYNAVADIIIIKDFLNTK